MDPKYFTLKEVMLSNHCPECYSNEGLRLTFKQRLDETLFYKSIVEDLKNELHCLTCNNPIYSGRWSRDIEQVIAYQERAVSPKEKSTKLKASGWLSIAFLAIIIVIIILFGLGIVKL
mgnify:CR=1 FL=1